MLSSRAECIFSLFINLWFTSVNVIAVFCVCVRACLCVCACVRACVCVLFKFVYSNIISFQISSYVYIYIYIQKRGTMNYMRFLLVSRLSK